MGGLVTSKSIKNERKKSLKVRDDSNKRICLGMKGAKKGECDVRANLNG